MDYPSDQGYYKLAAIARERALPDYVTHSPVDMGVPAASTYADRVGQLFPCHTKAATWLSAAYFADAAEAMPAVKRAAVASQIQKFGDFWGIGPDVAAAMRPTPVKQAAAPTDDDYAYVWRSEQGHVVRHLPVRGPSEVKVATNWLQKHREEIPYTDRRMIAGRLLSKVARWETAVDAGQKDFLERQAGFGVVSPVRVAELCRAIGDSVMSSAPDVKRAADALADAVTERPELVLNEEKAAAVVEAIYALRDDARQYGDSKNLRALFPEDIVHELTATKAAALKSAAVDWPGGVVYLRSELAGIEHRDLSAAFGPDFAKMACTAFTADPDRLAAAAQTLSPDELDTLSTLLADRGVWPAHTPPLSRDELLALV